MAINEGVAKAIEALRAVCGQSHSWEMSPGTTALPSRKLLPTCWHCNGSGECNCSACGVMKPSTVWASGECVACKRRKARVQ
jgi:hypothetical protein